MLLYIDQSKRLFSMLLLVVKTLISSAMSHTKQSNNSPVLFIPFCWTTFSDVLVSLFLFSILLQVEFSRMIYKCRPERRASHRSLFNTPHCPVDLSTWCFISLVSWNTWRRTVFLLYLYHSFYCLISDTTFLQLIGWPFDTSCCSLYSTTASTKDSSSFLFYDILCMLLAITCATCRLVFL